MLRAAETTGSDTLAELHVPLMLKGFVTKITAVTIGSPVASAVAQTALVIEADIDTAAVSARQLPPANRLPFLLSAPQAALGKLGLAVAKHAKYTPPAVQAPASNRTVPRNNYTALPKEYFESREICKTYLRGNCSRPRCIFAHPPGRAQPNPCTPPK